MKHFINRALVAKKHLKLFFALFAMLALGVGNAWAEEVTANFGWSNWDGVTESFSGNAKDEVTQTVDGVVVIYTRNGASLYANNTALRFYQSNTLKFDAPSNYSITSITFACTTYKTDITSNTGTCTATSSGLSWSGDASSVTFTRPSGASGYATITSATITLSSAGDETPEPDPDPTPDPGTGTTGTLVITRASFPSGSLTYNTTDNWSETASTGETVSGQGDLYSTSNQTTMQTKNSSVSTHYHNTTAMPGAISKISVEVASGTDRSYTVYASTTAITSTTGLTSLGSLKGATPIEIDPNKDYKYFWLQCTGGASYLNNITITYNIESSSGGEPETPATELTNDQFAWSAATAEATMGASNTFPTLTNTLPVSVTYESSTPATAKIDATSGAITLVAPGTTTISAKFAGGEVSGTTYAAKTVKYDLTVLKAPATPTENVYVKVTDAVTDGEYLIVYEDASNATPAPVAFDGSLTTLDAVSNNIAVTITDGTIAGNTDIDAATFTIDNTAGTLKSASGYYIGKTASGNGLNTDKTTAYTNTITIDADKNAVVESSGGSILRYNKASDQARFRYYGSGQQAIALYKKASEHTITIATCTNGSVVASVVDGAKVLSGTTVTLENTPATGYKLAAYDVYKTDDATTKVTVTDGKFIMPEFDVTISATFEAAKTLNSIEITTSATQTTFWQGETFNHNGLKVTAHFDGAADEDVTDKVTVTGSTATAGAAVEVTVSYNEGATTKTANYDITVKAIPNTKETAYTVADAYDIIDKLTTAEGVFISGIISQVDSYNSSYKSITYWITDESKQLQVYGGKGLKTTENPEGNFESINDLVVNADVVVCGKLKKFTQSGNTIYEFDVNSYLVSYNPPADVEPKAITIDAEIEGGSISIRGNLTEANPGTTITLYYQADDHYTFTSWSVTDENGNPVEVENNTFTMPETAVTISAVFTENAKYTLTLVAEPIAGGSVKFEGKDGSAIEYYVDETPTIIAEPNGGYLFNSWSVSGTATLQNASKATTTVTEFSSAVTITANFVEVKEITITLHEPGSKTSTVNCYANQQIYLPNATTLAEGKTFVGWTTNSNLTSATKPASAFYEKNILYTVPATATDLYAVYATASGTEYILTNAASITQGEYVLTDKDYKVATGSFQKENEEGGDLVVTEVGATVNDNKITTLPDGAAVCTLAGNNEDGFTILFEEGYLGYMSTNQNRNLAFKNEFSTIKWIAEAHKDKVNGLTLYSPYGGDSKYRISTNGSGNTTIRGYNNGAAYKELYLFRETSSYSNYTTSVTLQLTMAFEKEVYTVRYGETFETPELQTNYIVTGVTYNSSEPTVASVNTNTGEISTGEIGQTTITATYAGTSEYSAASASYILKVVSPNVDIITSAELTATSTQYKEFEHVGTITGTTYIGKTAKNGENIQISDDGTRGDGIVSIKSKGYIRSITITFVTSDKQVDIYGSELPYNSSKDLYDNNTRGASLGSLMASGGEYTKTLTIADDINIPHIGIRAKNGAVQIEEIAIEWEMYDLVRAVNKGYYGTICLKNNVVKYDGATFFEVAGKEDNKLVFDEVTELEAGKPYIFLAESDELVAIYGTETATEAGKHNSLQGTFEYITDGEAGAVGNKLEGNYMVVNNIIKKCGARCKLPENRAYFVATELESLGTAPAQMPGRRRVTMGVTGENEATGVDNITENGVIAPKKLIENGQLIIIRDGVKYNVQGQKL